MRRARSIIAWITLSTSFVVVAAEGMTLDFEKDQLNKAPRHRDRWSVMNRLVIPRLALKAPRRTHCGPA